MEELLKELIEVSRKQLALLEKSNGTTDKLGFCDKPEPKHPFPKRVFINSNNKAFYWYSRKEGIEDFTPEPIQAKALKCKILDLILFDTSTTEADRGYKLKLLVDVGGQVLELESASPLPNPNNPKLVGAYSKGLIARLLTATDEQLANPIYLVPTVSTQKNQNGGYTLLCEMYDSEGTPIMSSNWKRDSEIDWLAWTNEAIEKVRRVCPGYTYPDIPVKTISEDQIKELLDLATKAGHSKSTLHQLFPDETFPGDRWSVKLSGIKADEFDSWKSMVTDKKRLFANRNAAVKAIARQHGLTVEQIDTIKEAHQIKPIDKLKAAEFEAYIELLTNQQEALAEAS